MIMVVVTWLSVKTICTFKRVDFTAYKISLTTPGFGKLSRMKTGKNSCQQGKVKLWLSCILECLQQLNIEAHECTALEIAQCSWKSEVHNSLHIRSISTKNGAKYVFLHEHTYKQARKRTKLLTGQPLGRRARGSLSTCMQSDLSSQCSLYCTLAYEELEHPQIWCQRRFLEPSQYWGMAFYHERGGIFIVRVYNENLNVCVYIYMLVLSRIQLYVTPWTVAH